MSQQRLFYEFDQAHRALITHVNKRLRTIYGVSSAQLAALFLIRERRLCTAADIARAVGIRKSAVSGLLSRLVKAGLVARRQHAEDGRRIVLRLTKEGENVRSSSIQEVKRLQAEWLAGLRPTEVDTFARVVTHTRIRFKENCQEDDTQ